MLAKTMICLVGAVLFAASIAWPARGQEGQAVPVEHHYADVNGVRLHYASAGSGKLILFLHGFPEFWHAWQGQLAEFGKDHQAVAPDMRGYNLSSKPAEVEQYQIQQLVEDVRALGEKLGHKKFILVGHDWGGVVAWVFAETHPEALEKLVIINAPHPAIFAREIRENPAQQMASGYMLLFRSPAAETVLAANNYAQLVKAIGLDREPFTEEDRLAYLEAWSQPGALTGGLNYYRAAGVGPAGEGENAEAAKAAANDPANGDQSVGAAGGGIVKTPTLVIWGLQDTALLAGNLSGIGKLVPNLKVKLMPDAGHWVVHERPTEVNAAIREFVEGK
jgi:epoxide hydrolase 4